MPSKTSFFNKTLYRKNFTRFAPLWGLYTLCLVVGVGMMYADDGAQFWYAARMGESLHKIMQGVNLVYAALVALLLFGDLYNSRLCNALHAMPVRREGIFLTNVLSGLTFSALPTAVMALLSLPLLLGTCVAGSWRISLLWFLGSNLQFICFFGIAVLCVFCTGNRYVMALCYAAVNCLSQVLYWIVDTFYTPMLYGVITPRTLANNLCPLVGTASGQFLVFDSYHNLRIQFKGREHEMVAHFSLEREPWMVLLIWTGVGIALLGLALVLYRRRKLECAGDALAFPALGPVLLVGGAIGGACLGFACVGLFLSFQGAELGYITLLLGLAVGWFAGKMVIARSTRVFRPRNWIGLAILAAVLVCSQVLTYWDVFRISDWVPREDQVARVIFQADYGREVTLDEPEQIRDMVELQERILQDRLPDNRYFQENGEPLYLKDLAAPMATDETNQGTAQPVEASYYLQPCRKATSLELTYELKNGKQVRRHYTTWTKGPTGDILRRYLNSWEVVYLEGIRWSEMNGPMDLSQVERISVYAGAELDPIYWTQADAQALVDAIKADCAAGTMVQSDTFHDGYFVVQGVTGEETTMDGNPQYSIDVRIQFPETSFRVEVYPDSANVLAWIRERGADNGFAVYHDCVEIWYR